MTVVNILCFLVVCVKRFGHRLESSSTSQLLALSSLENTGDFQKSVRSASEVLLK